MGRALHRRIAHGRTATVGDGSSSTSTTEQRGIGGGLLRQANEGGAGHGTRLLPWLLQ